MNIYDPSNVEQRALTRTRAVSYKKCTDQISSEIMVRMGSSYSIDIKAMAELLRKTLSERKHVDYHISYNVRLRACRRKSELESANIEIETKHFDESFIKDYRTISDNYSKGGLFIIYYSRWLIE